MDIAFVAAVSLTVNFILGRYRRRHKKMTLMWWVLIHASIPLILPLRIWLEIPAVFIPLYIALAVLGQMLGTRLSGKNLS